MFSKPSFLSDNDKKSNILKIVAIAFPAVFILLFELLRQLLYGETHPVVAVGLSAFIAVILAALFYMFVFKLMARVQQENLRRNRELSILRETSLAVNESLNLNVLLPYVMEKLIQVTGADSGELFLIDEKGCELSYTSHAGIPTEAFKVDPGLLANDVLAGEVARSNKPVVIGDTEDSGSAFTTALPVARFRSMAAAPLKSRDDVVGVFVLLSLKPGHFKLDDVGLLAEIGNQIGVAVENARLFERVQAAAIVEERERIAKELHDGLAQVLGYVITKSQATRQILSKIAVANDYLAELENVAHDLYTDTREDILGLRTAISGDQDMVSALRAYLARFSQMYGIRATFEVGDQVIPRLSPQTELQVIRIVQEALSNIRKHAKATHALVKVAKSESEVTLVIEDDGKGFDVNTLEQDDSSKFGIRTIKERAESIYSRLDIESNPQHGTRVTLSIPLNLSEPSTEEGE